MNSIVGFRAVVLVLVLVLVSLVLIACSEQPVGLSPQAANETLRDTPLGGVRGFIDAKGAYVWMGLPYAQPPVDALRWHAPRPVAAWQGQREALAPGSACAQIGGAALKLPEDKHGMPVGSEDCLYLNIWAPPPRQTAAALPSSSEKLPVMVWIHGGGNSVGSGSVYDGGVLATSQRVIVVSFNYRLGLFGWFQHPALHGDDASRLDRSGNYGTLDTIEALRWVQQNIAAFGGDPDQVTVFGESAGGRNVYGLLVSPLASGLFNRAIVQSGSLRTDTFAHASHFPDDDVAGSAHGSRAIINRLRIAGGLAADTEQAKRQQLAMSSEATQSYLTSQSTVDLLSVVDAQMSGMYTPPQLLRDGYVLPKEPLLDRIRRGQYNQVPFITGTNRDEYKLMLLNDPAFVTWYGPIPRVRDLQRYNQIQSYYSEHWKALAVDEPAALMSMHQPNQIYAYRFDWDEAPRNWLVKLDELMGAAHAFELGFVFGDFTSGFDIPGLFNEDNAEGRIALSQQMMAYWGHFAHHGEPGRGKNQQGLRWLPWSLDGEKVIVFDTEQDGGIRMSAEQVTVARLKRDLSTARDALGQQQVCKLYAELFLYSYQPSHHWAPSEYRDLGCADFPPEQFMP